MKKHYIIPAFVFLAVIFLIGGCISKFGNVLFAGGNDMASENKRNWQLIWADEFDSKSINTSKWGFETGNSGWGNNELEYYTDNRQENANIADGKLYITAIKEKFNNAEYTSSRMITKGKFEFTYGKVEIRAKLPKGKGVWPALWMLGGDIDKNPWPACGEIDIMELLGDNPKKIYATPHGPISGGMGISSSYVLTTGSTFADDFHKFILVWDKESLKFFMDNTLISAVTKSNVDSSMKGDWVYDHPFYILMNIAVGGNWPGNPDSSTIFPQQMIVDYVRVYQEKK